MEHNREIGERLVDAWLNLSSAIWNKRIVSGMTFNEIYVCNLLIRQQELDSNNKLTATDLCTKMGIFKSQMNRILNSMEKNGYIKRVRSQKDKRFVHIEVCENGIEVYDRSHHDIMVMVDRLVDTLGSERTLNTAENVNLIADEFRRISSEEEDIERRNRWG